MLHLCCDHLAFQHTSLYLDHSCRHVHTAPCFHKPAGPGAALVMLTHGSQLRKASPTSTLHLRMPAHQQSRRWLYHRAHTYSKGIVTRCGCADACCAAPTQTTCRAMQDDHSTCPYNSAGGSSAQSLIRPLNSRQTVPPAAANECMPYHTRGRLTAAPAEARLVHAPAAAAVATAGYRRLRPLLVLALYQQACALG